jgi:large subunit ribosomal protein L21
VEREKQQAHASGVDAAPTGVSTSAGDVALSLKSFVEEIMYAVIRAGGKQYKVAPGDVIRVEKVNGTDGQVEFGDVVAVSSEAGSLTKPGSEARVTGEIVEQGRGAKILVFHYKKKKQYKKLRGHRQDFSAVRITEIAFDGQSFKAPALPKKEKKVKKAAESHEEASAKPAKKAAKKKSAAKKAPAKKK